jgi:hypothetical protein
MSPRCPLSRRLDGLCLGHDAVEKKNIYREANLDSAVVQPILVATWDADKSLAFSFHLRMGCSTAKRIVLGWVKEVRTTKS